MLLIFPLFAFLLFVLICLEKGIEWRRSILIASVFWGTCLTAITEALSVPRMLTRSLVAVSWLAICIVGLLWWLILRRRPRQLKPDPLHREHLEGSTKALLAVGGLVVLLVAITAILAAPSTQDSMEYHLPRVVMWMSNHSVRFFPTPNYCQLIYGPWAEYAMMHTYLLWGTDRFVNLVEAISLLGCGIGVSLIAKLLGAGPRGQVLAAVISVTIPSGILEASGPQNTYVVSFWIVSTVAFLISAVDDPGWFNIVCAGLAAGLAIETKGTAYILLPFLVLACWWMSSVPTRLQLLRRSAVCLLLVLAINMSQYLRCYTLSGTPTGLPLSFGEVQFTMGHVGMVGRLANSLRNIALHVGTPSNSINSRIEHVFRVTMQGMGVNPDDSQATIWGEPFHLNHLSLNEVTAGNPLNLVLFVVLIGVIFWKRQWITERKVLLYALGIVLSFVLFSALLRWQMWSARYHLPLFVAASALAGVVLEKYCSRRFAVGVGVIFLAWGLIYASMNRFRSLLPVGRLHSVWEARPLLYFADDHEKVAANNIAVADAVNQSHCSNVAIDSYTTLPDAEIKHSPTSFFVYPLLALMHADGSKRTVWYSGVHNLTLKYANADPHPAPCAVVCLSCARVSEKWAQYEGVGGRASVFDNIVVFGPGGTVSNSGQAGSGN